MISAEIAKQSETTTDGAATTAATAAVGAAASQPVTSQPPLPPCSSSPSLLVSSPASAPTSSTGFKTSSAAIFARNSVRPARKTPTFSIVVPEREAVAMHVQNVGGNTNNNNYLSPAIAGAGPSDASLSSYLSPSASVGFGSAAGQRMVTPSGYHEHTFGTSAFHATRLLPLLYLGNEGDAGMPNELRHRNIKRVLNVAFDCATQDYEKYGIQVLHLPLRDCGDEDIGSHFEHCCRWIHEGITRNEGVIVHCRLGVSRSATIAIAYLMTYGISQPTRILSQQHRYRIVPIDQQAPQGQCRTCALHGRRWLHYEDNAERINRGEYHVHPEECPADEGKCFTDYGDVFTYVSMRREHISPNIGFAMQLRKLNVEHGFRDFLSEMSPGPSDDYCSSLESGSNITCCPTSSTSGCALSSATTGGITPVTAVSMSGNASTLSEGLHAILRGGHGGGGPNSCPVIIESPLHDAPKFSDSNAKAACV